MGKRITGNDIAELISRVETLEKKLGVTHIPKELKIGDEFELADVNWKIIDITDCLCDNVLHPRLANEFIRTNYAGQIGKGTHFGMN